MRVLRKRSGRMASVVIAVACIVTFNIFNTAFHQWSLEIREKLTNVRQRGDGINFDDQSTSIITHYNLANNERYEYEFRFEFKNNVMSNNARLMILFNGSKRTCADYWDFPVGRRILAMLRDAGFLILAICSKQKKFDREDSIHENRDVKWIYYSLQKWMDEIYFKQFQQYPRLYAHGISRGSAIAVLLSRVLPIQGLILTLFPGDWHGFLTQSDHPTDLQTRLQLDPVFANWFYFDFCYNRKANARTTEFCPFESNRRSYQPIPPTYFIHSLNDELFNLTVYIALVYRLRRESFQFGGALLNDSESIKFHVLSPATITLTYMKEMFDPWHSKFYASAMFYRYFTHRDVYETNDQSRHTCACLPVDFMHFERYPNLTQTWSPDNQNQYADYVNDIKQHRTMFCEEVCGDLYTHHAMSSRHLDRALEWTSKTDSRRRTFYVKDYLTRPLRIWMYEKTEHLSSDEPNYVNIPKEYHVYSPEYYLQEYVQRLKRHSRNSRHKLQWADNPLLADYFIIPSDLTYYYFSRHNNSRSLSDDYFNTLLTNIRRNFPYWTMVNRASRAGSNHILAIVNNQNMGILKNPTQKILKNVIQLVFTGFRDDMSNFKPHTSIVYRHRYDIVIPQFTRLASKTFVHEKTCLFFFAGSLDYTNSNRSARSLLWSAWMDMKRENRDNMTITMGGKRYQTMNILESAQENADYIQSMQSSVFALSPEGVVPWSTRIYDAIQLGSIPTILSNRIVLPFERFIEWASFSTKINANKVRNIIDYVSRLENFDQYVHRKLNNAFQYKDAFQWPYSSVDESIAHRHDFLRHEDDLGSAKNVFHYISLELRCRRLEQFYGLTANSFSKKSILAQEKACQAYPNICPCHDAHSPVAFQEFI